MIVCVLASGPSMSQVVADSVAHLPRVVVNDTFRLAPDADALCANDAAWWRCPDNADAKAFAGRKFSTSREAGVEIVPRNSLITSGTNSALLALHVAVVLYRATTVKLFGVDLSAARGAHFFGPHKVLKNTPPHRFEAFKQQFQAYARTIGRVEVINCSPESELKCFPFECALQPA